MLDLSDARRALARLSRPPKSTPVGPRRAPRGKTGLRGVYPQPSGRWLAKVRVAGRVHSCGTHDTPEAAAGAVAAKLAELTEASARA